MADDNAQTDKQKSEYEPPTGAKTAATWAAYGQTIPYQVSAGWTVLRKDEKPVAEIFSVSYVADTEGDRPVAFIFNGGPGASSAYLQLGAVGPVRVDFPADGSLPRVPARLVPNEESWLGFTDLVFVDPVGTGFSRLVDKDDAKPGETPEKDKNEFFGYKRDLESLCEFMGRWLSEHDRWGSPIFIAGESYGGYRVGRLVKMLQEDAGIGLNGAILISPALEFAPLNPNDYDVLGWVEVLPTMVLTAHHHGRARGFDPGATAADIRREAEEFATGDYALLLTRGAAMPEEERREILEQLADMTGLYYESVARAEGRIDIQFFARELLRDQGRVVGLYDGTITARDPFPDRGAFEGPDPTLAGIAATYTSAINRQLRTAIGLETDREYRLLSLDVNTAWKDDAPVHFFIGPKGATDDLRYGLALNPHLKAFITHGLYDLVTPYYGTDRLENLMRLDPDTAARLTVRHFPGGHMFYAWEQSRRDFAAAMRAFFADAL